MMVACTHHYEEAIPKLKAEFNEFYAKTATPSPTERRLMILKLIHYKMC